MFPGAAQTHYIPGPGDFCGRSAQHVSQVDDEGAWSRLRLHPAAIEVAHFEGVRRVILQSLRQSTLRQ